MVVRNVEHMYELVRTVQVQAFEGSDGWMQKGSKCFFNQKHLKSFRILSPIYDMCLRKFKAL